MSSLKCADTCGLMGLEKGGPCPGNTVAGNGVRYLGAIGPGDVYGPWLTGSQLMKEEMSLSLFS